jgi:catechol 2,3-dioxygenase-like lactoylglutathione lyase family enzyme
MEQGDHSECPIELRACPEHHRQLPVLSADELSDFFGHLSSDAEKPRCECGCADAHPEVVVGYCVWCSHVYVSYDAKTEAQHFLYFCSGAPEEIREAAQSKLARLDYLRQKGVGVVVEDNWEGQKGRGRAAYLDTADGGGGNTLGLIYNPDRERGAQESVGNDYPLGKVDHFAWVVNDVRKVDAYYTNLGFKPFASIDHAKMLDRIYRGEPGTYEMWLGWDRTVDAPREWVQQITGSDIYVEYGKKHGEGFHHLGLTVTDMDAAIEQMTARGAPPSQSAAWKTAKGKGRAVYVDTEPYGGVTLELIYNPR